MVAGVFRRQLVAVIGKTRDLMNVWPEEETFKLLAPDAPMIKPWGRKAIAQKLREKNKEIKNRTTYSKSWGQSKVTGFIFDVVGADEAERLVKNALKWEGKMRRLLVLRKSEIRKGKMDIEKKTLVQKKKGEVTEKIQLPYKASFSFVICYNCGGKGHPIKSCTSASRVVHKKIERKEELVGKGKKRVKIIDDNGFTEVVNTQRTSSPTPGPAPTTLTPEPRMVELVCDWNEVEMTKTKAMVAKVEQEGWKVKGPLTGSFHW